MKKLLKYSMGLIICSMVGMMWLFPSISKAFPVSILISATSNTYSCFTIDIVGNSGPNHFSPDTITIHAGDTVFWRNQAGTNHSVTSDSNWNTGIISPGSVSSPFTFFTLGTTSYYCKSHGSTFYGAIIVLPSPSSATRWEFFSKSEPIIKFDSKSLGENPLEIVYNPSSNTQSSNHSPSNIAFKIGGSIQLSGQFLHKSQ